MKLYRDLSVLYWAGCVVGASLVSVVYKDMGGLLLASIFYILLVAVWCFFLNILAKSDLRSSLEISVTLLRMARGNFEGVSAFFARQLEKSSPLRRQVGLHYHLARSLSHEGRTDEARDHLLFAAENGGDPWYVSAAKKQLENM